jgi:hypothetical protein
MTQCPNVCIQIYLGVLEVKICEIMIIMNHFDINAWSKYTYIFKRTNRKYFTIQIWQLIFFVYALVPELNNYLCNINISTQKARANFEISV